MSQLRPTGATGQRKIWYGLSREPLAGHYGVWAWRTPAEMPKRWQSDVTSHPPPLRGSRDGAQGDRREKGLLRSPFAFPRCAALRASSMTAGVTSQGCQTCGISNFRTNFPTVIRRLARRKPAKRRAAFD